MLPSNRFFLMFFLLAACRSSSELADNKAINPKFFLEVIATQASFYSTPSDDHQPSNQANTTEDERVFDSAVSPVIEPLTGQERYNLSDPASVDPIDPQRLESQSNQQPQNILDPAVMPPVSDQKMVNEIRKIIAGTKPECFLRQGVYPLAVSPQSILGLSLVRFAKKVEGCSCNLGFVANAEVRILGNLAPKVNDGKQSGNGIIAIGKKTACEYSWDEKPGTTDYTTWDSYLKRSYPNSDRSQGESLQGSGMLNAGNTDSVMCRNGKILKSCFEKAHSIAQQDPLSRAFIDWSGSNGINPIRLRMAIAMKETHLGGLVDSCSGSSCNGVGLNQVITIVTDGGVATNSSSRPEWPGITHNILTNMKYSTRVLALKVREANPKTLWDLAKYYNGSASSSTYASAVVKNYETLSSQCGL